MIVFESLRRMIELKRIVALCAVPFALTACSTSSEVFDCEAGKGIGCKSISHVNRMVNKGQLGYDPELDGVNNITAPVLASSTSPGGDELGQIVLSDNTTVNRVSEQHLRVWMAPFQDEQGNLHEATVVHTVLKPGYWQLTPRA